MHVDSRNIRENVLMYQNRCFSQFALFDNDNDNNAVVILSMYAPVYYAVSILPVSAML